MKFIAFNSFLGFVCLLLSRHVILHSFMEKLTSDLTTPPITSQTAPSIVSFITITFVCPRWSGSLNGWALGCFFSPSSSVDAS